MEYIELPCWLDDHWIMVLYDDFSEEGKIFLGDTDGNWEETDEVPDAEDIDRAMCHYIEWVIENREDPLNQFSPRITDTIQATYRFDRLGGGEFLLISITAMNKHTFATNALYPVKLDHPALNVFGTPEWWRWNSRGMWVLSLPDEVQHDLPELVQEDLGAYMVFNGMLTFSFVIEYAVPRKEKSIKDDLYRLAVEASPGARARVAHWDLLNSELFHVDKLERGLSMLHKALESMIPAERRTTILEQDPATQVKMLQTDARKHMRTACATFLMSDGMRNALLYLAEHGINWEATARKWRKIH